MPITNGWFEFSVCNDDMGAAVEGHITDAQTVLGACTVPTISK